MFFQPTMDYPFEVGQLIYVKIEEGQVEHEYVGQIEHIFEKNKSPDRDMVEEYYGDRAPTTVFHSQDVDRIVINKKEEDDDICNYLIMPLNPKGNITEKCYILGGNYKQYIEIPYVYMEILVEPIKHNNESDIE